MPTYDYKCKKCSHVFEAFHGMNEKPLIKCPKCKSAAERLIGHGSGIIFKGTGFYETDYKKKTKSDSSCSGSGPSCSCCPKNKD